MLVKYFGEYIVMNSSEYESFLKKVAVKNEFIKSLEESNGSITFEEIDSEVRKHTYEFESDSDFGEDLVMFENNLIHFRAHSFYIHFNEIVVYPDPENDINFSIHLTDEEGLYLMSKGDKEELEKLKLILTDVQLMYLISFLRVLVEREVIDGEEE